MEPSTHQQGAAETDSHEAGAKERKLYVESNSILGDDPRQKGDSKTEKADCQLTVAPFACYLYLPFSFRPKSSKYWSWREELNLQPVVYKLGQIESDNTQEDSRHGKNKESEDSSS